MLHKPFIRVYYIEFPVRISDFPGEIRDLFSRWTAPVSDEAGDRVPQRAHGLRTLQSSLFEWPQRRDREVGHPPGRIGRIGRAIYCCI